MRNLTALSQTGDLAARYAQHDKARSYVQWIKSLAAARGDWMQARQSFAANYPNCKHLDLIEKAAVDVGTTDGWGEALSPVAPLANAFLEVIRPRTVLGRMTGLRRVPFRVSMVEQTVGTSAGWVREGRPIPVTAGAFDRFSLELAKIAGIVVLTDDLVRSSDPAAETVLQSDLGDGIAQFTDLQFIDPTVAAVPDVSPASITNGAQEIESTGTTAAAVEADLDAMIASLIAGGVAFAAPYFIMSPESALHLTKLRGTGGTRIFPDLGVTGGEIKRIPVLVSPSAGSTIVLLDASEVMLADDGLISDIARHASVQLDSAPDDPPDADTPVVSFWQMGLVGVRAVRRIRWQRRRDAAVAWMTLTLPEPEE